LTEHGFTCEQASNGEEALGRIGNKDLVVLDVMRPRMDGLTLAAKMRSQGNSTPVIFLTARDQTKDVVAGLEAGGDDYLVKPFKLDELVARIRSILRRAASPANVLKWHDLELDTRSRVLLRSGREILLSSTEFALLDLLMRHADTVVSKQLALSEIWRDEGYRDENIVETYINYLRKKTESFGGRRVIQTVRGSGYMLAVGPDEP
jgi:two-component system response regulator MprA